MRFHCLGCNKSFGWTAKKTVSKTVDGYDLPVTMEYIVCPYCESLDFEEDKTGPHPTKSVPPVQLPQRATEFDVADLIDHEWKGRKQGDRNYVNKGKLPKFGWDFRAEFQPTTINFLESCKDKSHLVGNYQFVLDGKIVKMQTVNQK